MDRKTTQLPVTPVCLFPVMWCMDMKGEKLVQSGHQKEKCQLTITSQGLEASRLGNQEIKSEELKVMVDVYMAGGGPVTYK